jgi:GNAT superfamily N-acetyltransferase
MRRMNEADIEAGLRLCRASGWNQLEADWRIFLEGGGCRVVETDGRVTGTVATLRYEDRFSWISMLLVDPEMRRRGIGTELLHTAMEILADMPSVRLDATPAGKMVYDQYGFVDEYPLARMRAVRVNGRQSPARPMTGADLEDVLERDREVFGADRSVILRRLYGFAPEYARITDGGYCFGRHGFRAEQIGPVVADDVKAARALVLGAAAAHPESSFLLDAAEHNPEWLEWLTAAGFAAERPFIRMYRGSNPFPGIPERVFAIAGPELG